MNLSRLNYEYGNDVRSDSKDKLRAQREGTPGGSATGRFTAQPDREPSQSIFPYLKTRPRLRKKTQTERKKSREVVGAAK